MSTYTPGAREAELEEEKRIFSGRIIPIERKEAIKTAGGIAMDAKAKSLTYGKYTAPKVEISPPKQR